MADVEHSLATYVSDMLAVEEHVCVPFKTQRDDNDFISSPVGGPLVSRLVALSETHIQALQSALDAHGGHPAHAAKSALTNIEGWVASAIDKMRKTKVAKGLRDDYTAMALCTAGYAMLLTTANAFRNTQVAQLAKRHLEDYAQALMDVSNALPAVVVEDLKRIDMPVDEGVIVTSQEDIRDAWRAGEGTRTPTTTTGVIETEATINRTQNPTYPTI